MRSILTMLLTVTLPSFAFARASVGCAGWLDGEEIEDLAARSRALEARLAALNVRVARVNGALSREWRAYGVIDRIGEAAGWTLTRRLRAVATFERLRGKIEARQTPILDELALVRGQIERLVLTELAKHDPWYATLVPLREDFAGLVRSAERRLARGGLGTRQNPASARITRGLVAVRDRSERRRRLVQARIDEIVTRALGSRYRLR